MWDKTLIASSPVLDRYLQSHPDVATETSLWNTIQTRQSFEQAVGLLQSISEEQGYMSALRQLRTEQQMRFIYRELYAIGSLQERMRELSDFADVCVKAVLRWIDPDDRLGLIVFALGKLGGGVSLIFPPILIWSSLVSMRPMPTKPNVPFSSSYGL